METYKGTLLSASNISIRVYGQAKMNVRIGRHMILVVDIANEGLIGIDSLWAERKINDFVPSKVTCYQDPIIARCREGQERACRVPVAKTEIVAAGTWTILEGTEMKLLASGSWVVESLRGKGKEE